MTSLKSLVHDTYSRRRATAILLGLVLTALVPLAYHYVPSTASNLLLIPAVILVIITILMMMRPGIPDSDDEERETRVDPRSGAGLILYLSPVILLNAVYPLVSPTMAAVTIDGVRLSFVVLASSVTVPWLAQAACLPVYRVIGALMAERDMDAITRRFCQYWPLIFLQALPLVAVFALPLWLATGWSFTALLSYAALCGLHLLFVQSLVLGNVGSRRGLWAAAWTAYAAALFAAPTVWWLPPVLGTLTQIAAMGRGLRHLGTRSMGMRNFSTDAIRGLLLGAVLWADKYVLFLVTGGEFLVVVLFAAMLPAVLAYNFYFVNLAPGVDRAVAGLHRTIERAPLDVLVTTSRRLSRIVDRSVLSTGAIGIILTLAVSLALGSVDRGHIVLAVAAGVATWAFMILTLLSYQLDYIGERVLPQIMGGVHLLVCVFAFILLGFPGSAAGGAGAYAALAVTDLALVCVAWVFYKRHWSQPEYTLFWRHATSW